MDGAWSLFFAFDDIQSVWLAVSWEVFVESGFGGFFGLVEADFFVGLVINPETGLEDLVFNVGFGAGFAGDHFLDDGQIPVVDFPGFAVGFEVNRDVVEAVVVGVDAFGGLRVVIVRVGRELEDVHVGVS